MTPNTQYMLQILEKIGSPLMRAVIAQDSNADDAALQEQAKTMAALLSRTVQVSIGMSQSFDFAKTASVTASEEDGDTLRVALAALAGPLVADQYSKMGRLPADQDLQRLTSTLDSVLTFSENFSPNAKDAAARLENIDGSADVSQDPVQRSIHYIGAFLPVIDAVARFSFGQSEKKLVLDVSEKLVKRTMDMRETIFSSVQGEDAQKTAEIKILAALGQVYAACHEAQIAALSAGDDGGAAGADPEAALERLWKSFEMRCAMIEAVMGGLNLGAANAAAGVSPVAPAVAAPAAVPVEAPVTPPPVAPDDAAVKPAPQEAAPETPTAPPADAGVNPMAMFSKPKTDAPPPPSEPEAAPPAPPPESPQPPTEAPPETPPAAPESGAASGGGPMSFFKKPDDGEDA
jgi:hypothetical protein